MKIFSEVTDFECKYFLKLKILNAIFSEVTDFTDSEYTIFAAARNGLQMQICVCPMKW